ncbi:hypothetical protein [Terrabacter sp. NPDC080008]|uniref:hypothetical protein n=1 Tax=Terrabacter sp. NPDC080008 TaxID=3155176 RepID=UPI00344B815E
MARQFLLEGRSLDELAREATQLYGPGARIVRAERVLDAGVAGFLGRRHLEVTVEVPDAYAHATPAPTPTVHVLGDRAGILALLDSADQAEDLANGLDPDGTTTTGSVPSRPTLPETPSTESIGLGELLARLGEQRHGRAEDAAAAVPALLQAAGDLVLVLGLADSAHGVVATMAAAARQRGEAVAVHQGGAIGLDDASTTTLERRRLVTRWDAAEARAHAVEADATVLTAYGLGSSSADLPHLESAKALAADQVWLVVDARHKPEDTETWVRRVLATMSIDALAVVGAGETATPQTVNRLGIPLGWLDGQPAPRTVLAAAPHTPSVT